jgi:hypothetical protein
VPAREGTNGERGQNIVLGAVPLLPTEEHTGAEHLSAQRLCRKCRARGRTHALLLSRPAH